METQTNIIVTLQVEGFHCWPKAGDYNEEVDFLSHPHRHIFHIKCKKRVTHNDRQTEIILFKRELLDYFDRIYGTPAAFGTSSCEHIATDLMEAYDLESAEVMEDNENGAEVVKLRNLKNPW